jgi:hypothetical protein
MYFIFAKDLKVQRKNDVFALATNHKKSPSEKAFRFFVSFFHIHLLV